MRFISTRAHGFVDYLMGVLLVAAPWLLFNSAENAAATWVPVVLGLAGLLTSLMTAYELGLVKLIPMPAHLGADVLVGAVLVLSPWLFGFADEVWLPHVALGILEIGLALMTQTRPSDFAVAMHSGHPSASEGGGLNDRPLQG